jgi:triphosphatase
MNEIELKFQIPEGCVDAIRACITSEAGPDAREPLPLHAAYFDTPDSTLARHKMALRVRREGPDWVQTFKGAGADAMTRLEENQPVNPPEDGRPRPDLSCHGPNVQATVRRALPSWDADRDPRGEHLGLNALYETRFDRWHCAQGCDTGQVTVCLDIGEIVAGPLHEPLAELELELLRGHPMAVITQARVWVSRFGVWLDVQSKAMKGTRLARQAQSGQRAAAQVVEAPTSTPTPTPTPSDAHPAAWRAWLSGMLDACAGNWAELANARPEGRPALKAWHQAMQTLQDVLSSTPSLRAALPESFTHDHARLLNQLTLLVDAPDERAAQALARAPETTLWALDILTALVGPALAPAPASAATP